MASGMRECMDVDSIREMPALSSFTNTDLLTLYYVHHIHLIQSDGASSNVLQFVHFLLTEF